MASLISLFIVTSAHAELTTTVSPTQVDKVTTNTVEIIISNDQEKMICLIEGNPSNTDYKILKRIKAGKGTYGSVEDVYPKIIAIANHYNADAIINYRGSQRFGFWPWRIVRPVITGTAVKFNSPLDCNQLNGKLI